jgi:hypothetical protein
MKNRRLLNYLCLAAVGALLSLPSLARASDLPMLDDARDLLEKAWNPGGDTPSDADRIQLLNAALADLQKTPRGHYHHHLEDALAFVKSALYQLQKGDPDHKAGDIIRSALDEVRDLT